MKYNYFVIGLILFACESISEKAHSTNHTPPTDSTTNSITIEDVIPIADLFDFPVGKPNAKGYYNAQPFQENEHLGDDWNAVTGGNSDLGDTIFAIANGRVTFAEDVFGGWGNIVRVIHTLPNQKQVESLYAHCDTILVRKNDIVNRGQAIATIGTAHGSYLAHLHFEIRDSINMEIGGGYSTDTSGYIDPTAFIRAHQN